MLTGEQLWDQHGSLNSVDMGFPSDGDDLYTTDFDLDAFAESATAIPLGVDIAQLPMEQPHFAATAVPAQSQRSADSAHRATQTRSVVDADLHETDFLVVGIQAIRNDNGMPPEGHFVVRQFREACEHISECSLMRSSSSAESDTCPAHLTVDFLALQANLFEHEMPVHDCSGGSIYDLWGMSVICLLLH
jgi:hypothetical protein